MGGLKHPSAYHTRKAVLHTRATDIHVSKISGSKGSGTSKVHTWPRVTRCHYTLHSIVSFIMLVKMHTLVQYTIIQGCVLSHEHEVQLNYKRLYCNIYLAVAPCDARGAELKGGADAEPDALVD